MANERDEHKFNLFIGNEIKILRKQCNQTQELLSEKASLSTTYLGQIERGERIPSFQAIEKISFALGITVGEFLSNIARKSKQPIDENTLIQSISSLPEQKKQFITGIVELLNAHFADRKQNEL